MLGTSLAGRLFGSEHSVAAGFVDQLAGGADGASRAIDARHS